MVRDLADDLKAKAVDPARQELGTAIAPKRAAKVGHANQKQGVLEYTFKAKCAASKSYIAEHAEKLHSKTRADALKTTYLDSNGKEQPYTLKGLQYGLKKGVLEGSA